MIHTIDELTDQFKVLTEEEIRLKNYFQSYGKILDDRYYDLLGNFDTTTKDQMILEDIKQENRIILEDSVFDPKFDISIIKHPKYLFVGNHSHDFFEIVYVISGSCHQTIQSGEKSEKLKLREGNVLVIPPSVTHSIAVDDESTVMNILLRRSTFNNIFFKNIPGESILQNFFTEILYSHEHPTYILFNSIYRSKIYNTFANLYLEYLNHSTKKYSSNAMNVQLELFLIYLLSESENDIILSNGYNEGAAQIPSIINFIEKHYTDITVNEIAEHFNYNPNYLGKLFKKNTNSTLSEVIINIRLNHAKDLLIKSNTSVEEIAFLVGYSNVSSFIRSFKKSFDLTPSRFRQKAKY